MFAYYQTTSGYLYSKLQRKQSKNRVDQVPDATCHMQLLPLII